MKRNDKNTKKDEIKLRITTQDKECIEHIAKTRNMSMSSFIRDTCLCTSNTYFTALEVETNNVFNEIYHYFKKQGNTESADSIKTLHEEYIQRRNRS